MRLRLSAVAILLCLACALHGQSSADTQSAAPAHRDSGHYQLFGGYTWLSNSFNGLPGHKQSLNGFEASLAFPYVWRGLRFKADFSDYNGSNYGASQDAYFITGGWQYDYRLGHETLFGHAMAGDIGINQDWGPQGHPGMTASFTTVVGGGLDTPVSKRFAIRVGGDWVYENFALILSKKNTVPYHVAGLPNYMGKVNAGVVWKF